MDHSVDDEEGHASETMCCTVQEDRVPCMPEQTEESPHVLETLLIRGIRWGIKLYSITRCWTHDVTIWQMGLSLLQGPQVVQMGVNV